MESKRRLAWLTEWLALEQEEHLHAAPCLVVEHAPQGHPLPWVEGPATAEDFPGAETLRQKGVPAGAKAAAVPMVVMAETAAVVTRTIVASFGYGCCR